LLRCRIAAGLCGAAAYGVDQLVEARTTNWMLRGAGLGLAIAVSLPVYFGAAQLLRLQESGEAWRMLRRRIPGLA
jgi:hypothetical protein